MKICSNCKQEKSNNEFHKNIERKGGLVSWCKKCCSKYYKEHQKEYNQRPEVKKRIRENNQRPEVKKRRYKSNKQWSLKYPHRAWAICTIVYHRGKGYEIQITRIELEQLAKETTTCFYCGKFLVYRNKGGLCEMSATLDRIDNGKTIRKGNIRIISHKWNMLKGKRTHDEFVKDCEIIAKKFS